MLKVYRINVFSIDPPPPKKKCFVHPVKNIYNYGWPLTR